MSATVIKRRGLSRVPKGIVPYSTACVPARLSESEFVEWSMSPRTPRAEWVDGRVEIMPPVSADHGDINGFFIAIVREFVEAKRLGPALGPEFMVCLTGLHLSRRIPDLLFVSSGRLDLIRKAHLEGPPDITFEIVSADDLSRDYRAKYLEYQAAGVKEYWIVDPLNQLIEAYELDEVGNYRLIEPDEKSRIRSNVIKGFFLHPIWLFGTRRATVRSCLKELGISRCFKNLNA